MRSTRQTQLHVTIQDSRLEYMFKLCHTFPCPLTCAILEANCDEVLALLVGMEQVGHGGEEVIGGQFQ